MVEEALDVLDRTVAELQKVSPTTSIHVDLAELRGYRYHTGMVFAAFAPGHGREIARGGRYAEMWALQQPSPDRHEEAMGM